jgi:predicted transcriptional regulator
MSLSEEVLQILRDHGPSTCDEIRAHSEQAKSRTQLANNLYQMAHRGLLRKERDGNQVVYRLATKAEQRASGTGRQASSKKATSKKAEVESASAGGGGREAAAAPAREDDPVRKHLVANAKQNQEAIDAYLRQVGDPAVVAALTASRDRASDALTTYDQVAPA